jgi:hypothetical protein
VAVRAEPLGSGDPTTIHFCRQFWGKLYEIVRSTAQKVQIGLKRLTFMTKAVLFDPRF